MAAHLAHNQKVGGFESPLRNKPFYMKANIDIEQAIADTIIERPQGFKIEGRQFYLYPITLGKSYLLSRIMTSLGVNNEVIQSNPYLEALRLANTKKSEILRIIAYHTLEGKEVLDNVLVEERIDYLSTHLDEKEMAQIFMTVLSQENVSAFIKHLKIDKEKEAQSKVMKCKKENKNTFTFGGKSVYGTLIDHFCQRYGWTMDYVVWGISYNNLQMLMADEVTTIHLDDKEAKRCRVSNDRRFISGDDPKNIERIRKMFSD